MCSNITPFPWLGFVTNGLYTEGYECEFFFYIMFQNQHWRSTSIVFTPLKYLLARNRFYYLYSFKQFFFKKTKNQIPCKRASCFLQLISLKFQYLSCAGLEPGIPRHLELHRNRIDLKYRRWFMCMKNVSLCLPYGALCTLYYWRFIFISFSGCYFV